MLQRLIYGLAGIAMLAFAGSCTDSGVFDEPLESSPGHGQRITCQIICDGVGGEFRNFDEASSVQSAQSDCETVIAEFPEEYDDQCPGDPVPTACSCFEE